MSTINPTAMSIIGSRLEKMGYVIDEFTSQHLEILGALTSFPEALWKTTIDSWNIKPGAQKANIYVDDGRRAIKGNLIETALHMLPGLTASQIEELRNVANDAPGGDVGKVIAVTGALATMWAKIAGDKPATPTELFDNARAAHKEAMRVDHVRAAFNRTADKTLFSIAEAADKVTREYEKALEALQIERDKKRAELVKSIHIKAEYRKLCEESGIPAHKLIENFTTTAEGTRIDLARTIRLSPEFIGADYVLIARRNADREWVAANGWTQLIQRLCALHGLSYGALTTKKHWTRVPGQVNTSGFIRLESGRIVETDSGEGVQNYRYTWGAMQYLNPDQPLQPISYGADLLTRGKELNKAHQSTIFRVYPEVWDHLSICRDLLELLDGMQIAGFKRVEPKPGNPAGREYFGGAAERRYLDAMIADV